MNFKRHRSKSSKPKRSKTPKQSSTKGGAVLGRKSMADSNQSTKPSEASVSQKVNVDGLKSALESKHVESVIKPTSNITSNVEAREPSKIVTFMPSKRGSQINPTDTSIYIGAGPTIFALDKQPSTSAPIEPKAEPLPVFKDKMVILFKKRLNSSSNIVDAASDIGKSSNPPSSVTPASTTVQSASTFSKYIFMLTILCEICGMCAILLMIFWSQFYLMGFLFPQGQVDSAIDLHALCMMFGAVIIVGNTLVTFRVFPLKITDLDILHKCLAIFGLIMETIGISCAISYHILLQPPLDHLYSLHSWLGFIAYCLYFCQVIISCGVFHFPSIFGRARFLYDYHVAFGVGIFAINTITAISGFAQKTILDIRTQKLYPDKRPYNQLTGESIAANFAGCFLLFFAIMVSYLLTSTNFYQQVSLKTGTSTSSKAPRN